MLRVLFSHRASRTALLALIALAFIMLWASAPVRAGSYSVSYSGGTYYGHGGSSGALGNYPYSMGTSTINNVTYSGWGGNGGGATGTGSCSGSITATFTWVPASGQTLQSDPPPAQVLVTESSMASANALQYPATPSAKASINNGLGQSISPISPTVIYGGPTPIGSFARGVCHSAKYSAQSGGQTITVNCSPSASASGASSASTSVRYSASVTPITISLMGTTIVNGAHKALTGQQVTASLNVPSPYTVQANSRTWSVSGDIFKFYDPMRSSDQLVHHAGSDYFAPSFSFYDKTGESVNLTCTVNVVAPDNTTIAVTATAPQLEFKKPTVTNWTIVNGFVRHFLGDATTGSVDWWGLFGTTSGASKGMIWKDVTIDVPAPFPVSGGQGCFAQVVTPYAYKYMASERDIPVPLTSSPNQKGLDYTFPYANSWALPEPGGEDDDPHVDPDQSGNTVKYTVESEFKTWVMYKPPPVNSQNSVWVPLQSYNWTWSMKLDRTSTGWSLDTSKSYPSSAAAAPQYQGTNDTTPPIWSVVH